MRLIVGLGNPGAEYAATRHNIGFLAVDKIAPGGTIFSSKFHGSFANVTISGETLLLLKPATYMNRSGQSVQAAMAFYKLAPEQVIVVYDEIDLPLGKLRIKQGGGANGHNGIKDIDQKIGPNYWRIRLGVGRPEAGRDTADYVLGRFSKEEEPLREKMLSTVRDELPLFWQKSPDALASRVMAVLHPPAPKPQAPPEKEIK